MKKIEFKLWLEFERRSEDWNIDDEFANILNSGKKENPLDYSGLKKIVVLTGGLSNRLLCDFILFSSFPPLEMD